MLANLVFRAVLMDLSNCSRTFNASVGDKSCNCINSSRASWSVWPSVVFLYNW